MTVYILNSLIKKRDYDGIVLNENDFHPCHPFFVMHPEIQPESVDHIIIKGIFERCKYKRAVLRYCDYMLAKGGVLEIYFYNVHFENPLYVRSRNDWQYELSLVFGARALLIEQRKSDEDGFFKYKKQAPFLPIDDTIGRWTFGIVSSGRLNQNVISMIRQIESLNIPEYEIIVCGPSPANEIPQSVRVLDDSHLYPDLRIPISKKKNYIIDEAKYNNIALFHDRFMIPDTWYKNMKKHGNYFDLYVCNVLDEETHSNSMGDWVFHYPNPFPLSLKDILFSHSAKMSKDKWNENTYIPGGFFIFKKHFGIKLNPNCNWGEKEDVDFCRRAYNIGMLMVFDPGNTVYCSVVRTKTIKGKFVRIHKFLSHLYYKFSRPFCYLKEKYLFQKYLRS